MSRAIHIVGNWKMNMNLKDVQNFFSEVASQGLPNSENQFWVAPQSIHITEALKVSDNIKVGAQDCSAEDHGAFTGEISTESLKDLGAHFTLVGHSERRSLHNESHELLNKKTQKALANDLKVIFCVGETLEEREAGQTFEVVQEQLREGLKDIDKHSDIIIAYEPVWAIGTGKTATPEQAEEVHAMIRTYAAENLGFLAGDLVILYGGSVKPANVKELLACPNIDGGLVGGASLKADSYLQLS